MAGWAVSAIIDSVPSVDSDGYPQAVTEAYQWLLDGSPIAGATNATYTPTDNQAGHVLSVRVTFANAGDMPVTVTSDAQTVAPPMAMDIQVSVDGLVWVDGNSSDFAYSGQTVTAEVTGAPAGARLTYQWMLNGSPIVGATEQAYTPIPKDDGSILTVEVSASASGYAAETVVSSQYVVREATVRPGTVSSLGVVTAGEPASVEISNIPAADSAGFPQSPDVAYQWVLDGIEMIGVTSSTYTPTADQVGHSLSLVVCFSEDSDSPACITIPATPVMPSTKPSTSVSASIEMPYIGPFYAGETVTVVASSLTPSDATLTYQWIRDFYIPIVGATSSTYTLTPDDVGHVISVRVTASADGYVSYSTTASAGIIYNGNVQPGTVTLSGVPIVGEPVTAVVSGIPDVDLNGFPQQVVSYCWSVGGRMVTCTTDSSYIPTADQVGQKLYVSVILRSANDDVISVVSDTQIIAAAPVPSA
jgi:hypothetical protein